MRRLHLSRGPAAVTVVALTFSLQGKAEAAGAANGWGELGDILKQACSVGGSNMGIGGIKLNNKDVAAKMQWLCQLQSIHGYINTNILNGDWEGFAGSVAGDYVGKFLGYAGAGGGALNNFSENLNKALEGGYADFRKMLYGSFGMAFNSRKSLSEGDAPDSVGGMTYNAIKSNPVLAAAEQMARMRDSMEATAGLEKAYEAKKVQDEAMQALEVNTAQAMNNATAVIGAGVKEGIADRYIKDARTALSTREVAEVQVQLAGEAMRQEATMNVALMNQLGEMVQQQVMTNMQLMKESGARTEALMSHEAELNAAIANEALENKLLATQYAGEIKGAYANLASVIKDQEVTLTPVGQ